MLGLAGLGVLLVQVALSASHVGSTGADQTIADWSYRLLMSGAALAVVARAVLCSRDRLAWAMIGAGLVAWAVGDLYYDFVLHA